MVTVTPLSPGVSSHGGGENKLPSLNPKPPWSQPKDHEVQQAPECKHARRNNRVCKEFNLPVLKEQAKCVDTRNAASYCIGT